MARLVAVCRDGEEEFPFEKRQIPLYIDDTLTVSAETPPSPFHPLRASRCPGEAFTHGAPPGAAPARLGPGVLQLFAGLSCPGPSPKKP